MIIKILLLLGIGAVSIGALPDPSESEQVTLESAGLLQVDRELAGKIQFELSSIRRVFYAKVGDILHQAKWVPGQLLDGPPLDPQTRDKLLKINGSRYGPITVTSLGQFGSRIQFTKDYQPEILSGILRDQFNLNSEVNAFFGRSSTIEYNRFRGEYLFSRGSGDCPSGCTYWKRYLFREYSDGYLYLVWESEDPASQGELKAAEGKPSSYAPSEGKGVNDDEEGLQGLADASKAKAF